MAKKEKGIKEIAAVEWKDKPLDYEKTKQRFSLNQPNAIPAMAIV